MRWTCDPCEERIRLQICEPELSFVDCHDNKENSKNEGLKDEFL